MVISLSLSLWQECINSYIVFHYVSWCFYIRNRKN
jgi:hypothetical protein